jgi:hypothetical protein
MNESGLIDFAGPEVPEPSSYVNPLIEGPVILVAAVG